MTKSDFVDRVASESGLSKKDAGSAVDASGALPDGSPLNGVVSLREALLRRPEMFVRTLTEKLMIYSLGRGLQAYDQPVVRTIAREAAASDPQIAISCVVEHTSGFGGPTCGPIFKAVAEAVLQGDSGG